MVEAVDDVEERSLPALVKIGGLEEGALGDAVLPGNPVEVLDVVHGHEALAGSLFVEVGLGLATGQFVDEPNKDGWKWLSDAGWKLNEVEHDDDMVECWKVTYLQRMTPSLR